MSKIKLFEQLIHEQETQAHVWYNFANLDDSDPSEDLRHAINSEDVFTEEVVDLIFNLLDKISDQSKKLNKIKRLVTDD